MKKRGKKCKSNIAWKKGKGNKEEIKAKMDWKSEERNGRKRRK